MPKGRIKAKLIDNQNNLTEANIGLSGRTTQHFTEQYPSIDIRISGGDNFNGLSSFKLYQLKTKSGLKDFVFLSILKDMGFLVPRQELINLHVNGKDQGLYLLIENFNESTFTKQHRIDGNVIGLNTSKLFFDYSSGSQLELDFFNRIPEDPNPPIDTSIFLSEKFTNKLNKNNFAKYIAFASLYYSGHGLGVDDLRFYQDPTTNEFFPIPRDMNPGLGSQYQPVIRSYASQMGWLSNNTFYTINPSRNLEHQLSIESGSDLAATGLNEINNGLTDLHFSIIFFLSSSENLSLTNKYLNYFANNSALRKQIKIRLKDTLEISLKSNPKNKILLDKRKKL